MWESALRTREQPITEALLRRHVLPNWGKGFEKVCAAVAVRLAILGSSPHPQTLFILIPNGDNRTAQYIAAGLLVGHIAHKHGGPGLPAHEKGQLLSGDLILVTPSVNLSKASLKDLTLGAKYPLSDFWQVEALSRYRLARADTRRVFVANPGWVIRDLPDRKFGAVVIDAMHPRTQPHLRELLHAVDHVPLRIVVAPPLDRHALGQMGYPRDASVWMWDPMAQLLAESVVANPRAENWVPPQRTLWVCEDDVEASNALGAVYRGLTGMLRDANGQSVPGLRDVWGIFHSLRQLTVPLAQLEEALALSWSGSINDRVKRLGDIEGRGNVVWEALWPAIKTGTENLYQLFLQRNEPAKFWVLASRVEEWLRTRPQETLRVVVGSHHEALLLSRLLADAVDGVQEARINGRLQLLASRAEAMEVAECRHAHTLLCGFRSAKTRYLDVYPVHDVEEVVYPFEADIERSTQTALYEFAHQLEKDDGRSAFLSKLGLTPTSKHVCSPSPAPSVQCLKGNGQELQLAIPARIEGILDIDRLANATDFSPGDLSSYSDERTANGAKVTGDSVLVAYKQQPQVIRYPVDHRVDVFFPATDQIQRFAARDLRPGMQVIAFVDDLYEDLFRRLQSAVHEKLPPSDRVALELWDEAKASLLTKFHGSRRAIHTELCKNGLVVDPVTVASWFRDDDEGTLAPQQIEEFLKLARATGLYPDESLMTHTFSCIRHSRGRSRAAGRELKALLRAICSGEGYEQALESARKFEAALGDVCEAVEILEVKAVSAILRAPVKELQPV